MDISGAIAFVTGSNRGIGRALVVELLKQGAAKVYAGTRSDQEFDSLKSLDPARVVPVRIDITQNDTVTAAASQASDVNLLINNAGFLAGGLILGAPIANIRNEMEVNYFGTLQVARAFAPALIKNRGTLANVLSVVSLASMPGLPGYNASKAAAWSLTQSLRIELKPKGVKVIAVFPGPVDTEMSKRFVLPKTAPSSVAEEILSGVAMDLEDVFPDPFSKQSYATWKSDPKQLERQFAGG